MLACYLISHHYLKEAQCSCCAMQTGTTACGPWSWICFCCFGVPTCMGCLVDRDPPPHGVCDCVYQQGVAQGTGVANQGAVVVGAPVGTTSGPGKDRPE